MTRFLELRVHGVHSTPPTQMLGVASVNQVAGDSLTGFYRAADGAIPGRTIPEDSAVEAYSWGSLTTGTASKISIVQRMLWLTLLPFALANVASWARLTVGTNTARGRVSAAAVRLFALTLSVFFILAPCLIFSDLVAWQCFAGGSVSCPSLPSMFHGLAGLSVQQRLAAAMVPPLMVVALLWVLSTLTHSRYDDVTDPRRRVLSKAAEQGSTSVIRHPDLFSGNRRTRALRNLHIAAQLATVVGFTASHVAEVSKASALPWCGLGLSGAVILWCVWGVCQSQPDDIDSQASSTTTRDRVVFAALALVALSLIGLVSLDFGVDEARQFVGRNSWFLAVMVLMTTLHIFVVGYERRPKLAIGSVAVFLLLIGAGLDQWLSDDGLSGAEVWIGIAAAVFFWIAMVWFHTHSDESGAGFRPGEAAWRGAGASFLLGGSAWVALLFTATLVNFAGNYLNGPDQGAGDLVSLKNPRPATTPSQVSASGDLTFSNGVVRIEGNTLHFRSGSLNADSFGVASTTISTLTQTLPNQVVKKATIKAPEDAKSVALENVCVSETETNTETEEDTDTCLPGADTPGFVAKGALPISTSTNLQIDKVRLNANKPLNVHMSIPQVLIWTPIAQLAWLIMTLIALVLARGLALKASLRAIKDAARKDAKVSQPFRTAVAGSRASAAIAHRAEALINPIGYITTILLLLLMAVAFGGVAPWQLFDGSGADAARQVSDVSLWVAIGSSAALIGLATRLNNSESARRVAGVIWDLATFWPRIAHPLAPPCYAERVVPEVTQRINWARHNLPEDGLIVLSAHSQGSLISATVLSRLGDWQLKKVRFMTFGSQIRGLYGRVFPQVFGRKDMGYDASVMTKLKAAHPDALPSGTGYPQATPAEPDPQSLRARLSNASSTRSWVNLFRRSDPLGFRVFADGDSDIDVPTEEVTPVYGDPTPPLRGHSGYMFSQQYLATVRAWTGEETPPDSAGIAPLPPIIIE